MLMALAAVLAFVTIAGLGWVLVGGDDSAADGVKRAKALAAARPASAGQVKRASSASQSPEARRKQILTQLQDAERRDRKARVRLSARIHQAGLNMSVRTFIIISVVAGVLGFLFPLVLKAPLLLCLGLGVVLGFGVPRWALGFLAKRRIKKFSAAFADAVDILVRGIKTGLPVNDCFKIMARESPEPLGGEFQRLLEGLGVGMSLTDALDRMYTRMPTPELKFFCIVIAIQQKTGGNLAEALTNLTTVLRARRLMREKIKAMSSEAVASAMIIGSLPPLVMTIVMITSPSYMITMFTDPRGQFMLLVAGCWMGIGIFSMKKMINFKF
ncbi:type II secretion system F family protein [uncultured Brevundimonas sp.]|uniref:type II secretion system F family protein n=1 Tax=uncultured Brevundimonas sp. TaxID=213418 RepID=UPI00262B59FD|nr:type II secretion system F family protein [uncultured Brevundimonas sp.]